MTVIKAAQAPTVEDVVGRIKDNVWTLICAGEIPAALVLLRSQLADFERAWLPTYMPRAPLALPAPDVVMPTAVQTAGELASAMEGERPLALPGPDEDADTTDVVVASPEPAPTRALVHVVTETGAKVGVIRVPRVRMPRGRTRKVS